MVSTTQWSMSPDGVLLPTGRLFDGSELDFFWFERFSLGEGGSIQCCGANLGFHGHDIRKGTVFAFILPIL